MCSIIGGTPVSRKDRTNDHIGIVDRTLDRVTSVIQ